MKTLSSLLLLSIGLLSCACNATEPAPADDEAAVVDTARDALEAAQKAYAARDHRAMVANLRSAWIDRGADEAVRANALDVVDKALADGKGRLDAGFELPAGMTWMRLLFQRGAYDGGGASYLAVLNGGLTADADVADLHVVRERDGAVLASRTDGLGYFEVGGAGKDKYFYIHTTEATQPMERGAYRIEWRYVDGRTGSASVFVPSMPLEGAARIVSPAPDDVVHESRPTVRWEAPQWAHEAAWGEVFMEGNISSRPGTAGPHKIWWSTWERQPTKLEAKLEAPLEDRDVYTAAISYQWRIRYGALQLGASERTTSNFGVRTR